MLQITHTPKYLTIEIVNRQPRAVQITHTSKYLTIEIGNRQPRAV